jgi:hypothetical protein
MSFPPPFPSTAVLSPAEATSTPQSGFHKFTQISELHEDYANALRMCLTQKKSLKRGKTGKSNHLHHPMQAYHVNK